LKASSEISGRGLETTVNSRFSTEQVGKFEGNTSIQFTPRCCCTHNGFCFKSKMNKVNIRSALLLISLLGVIVSVFWEYIFPENHGNGQEGGNKTSGTCPFTKTTLANLMNNLPDIPQQDEITHELLDGPCETCIVVDNEVFDVGNHFHLFKSNQLLSLDEFARMLAGPDTPKPSHHAMEAARNMLLRKFPHIGDMKEQK
jgi:hypothetical protein